ncbi:DUF3105 domain-containing protein [Nocardioides sp. HDW12B]|uniref:DUF3105 domain-containing protein n=1 Tax=Nocardioides sp. HDW12B TaxID=2714939 RepID=UPI00197E089A|nr:DUF3105 domain-containing protein [Nocardioides sp. HDW12B]
MATKKSKKTTQSERSQRAAEMQAQARRAERRRSLLIIGGTGLVGVAIIGAAAFAVIDQNKENEAADAAGQAALEGVETFDDLGRDHVETAVEYPQTPSVGGDHNPVWQNCGFYDSEVAPENATHSLEHGAVWIGYAPDLADDQVTALEDIASQNDYVLVSPVEGMDSPVTLSAWGLQIGVDTVDDPAVEAFIEEYQQGPQTQEPGASCQGGVGSPL